MRLIAATVFAVALGAAVPASADAQVRLHGNAPASVSVMSWRDIPFRTVVRQQYDFSCGSAAVATLLRYHYGRPIREQDAFEAMWARGDQARIRQVGFSMLDMKQYLESIGLRAEGYRISLDRLAELRVPAIALITREGYRHFVVVKGVRGGEVLLGDPSRGLRRVPRAEFESQWNGIFLMIQASAGDDNPFGFNREEEWRPWTTAPIGQTPYERPIDFITRDLPFDAQILPPEALQ